MIMEKAKDTRRSDINKLVASRNKDQDKEIVKWGTAALQEQEDNQAYISTGIKELDDALGGGVPCGVITIFTGDKGSGKTGTCYECMASVTDAGDYTLYLNTEPPFNAEMWNELKVDPDPNDPHVLVQSPDNYGEQMVDTLDQYLFDAEKRSTRGLFKLIVLDSENNIVPKSMIDKLDKEGAEGNAKMAARAALTTQFVTRIQGRGYLRDGAACIVVVQVRANMNNASGHGPEFKMACAKALEHGAKIIVKFGGYAKKDPKTGATKSIEITWEIIKNNFNSRYGKGTYAVIPGKGVDDGEMLKNRGLEWGYIILDKSLGRSWYRILAPDGDRIVKGVDGLKELFATDTELKSVLRDVYKLGKPKVPPTSVGFEKQVEVPEETVGDDVPEE